jgi:Asp-tRNA(Asn)/Glu-tRNA(Gln) amidotransferase A subunit family amidase
MGMDRYQLGLREAVERIRTGALTSEDYTTALLERIVQCEPRIRAFAWLDRAAALEKARVADRWHAAGDQLGLLHGIPVGIKDIIATAGIPTEMGSALFAGRVPKESAAVVRRLETEGGFVFGKTVTAELAYFHPGATRNPWNSAHTSGGSSMGSAAVVAAGMAPLALGTQTNGSVIRPAAFCGCVGYKPSAGLLGRSGIQPFSPTLDQVGVFTRSVEDAALAAAALIGHDPDDVASDAEACARARVWPLAPSAPPRLAVVRSPVWELAEPAQQQAFATAVARLRAAGASVEEVELPEAFDAAHAVQRTIMYAEGTRTLGALQAKHRAALSEPLNRLIDEGRAIADATLAAALAERHTLQNEFARFLAGYDAIVTPPARGEAPAIREHTGDPTFCTIWTLVAAPALTLPAVPGPQGLPLGLQVVGALHDDAQLLGTARWIEQALDWPHTFPA